MTYDAYPQTTALPTAQPFPITEELPAVPPGRRRGGPGGGAKWLAALLVLVIALAVALLVAMSLRSDDNAAPTLVEPTSVVAAAIPDGTNDGEVVQNVAQQDPGYYQVVGVPDGLNVRSGPGTDNGIVGALAAGQRHVFATGQLATVRGAEWRQVVFGESDALGWVSGQFLSLDTAPTEESAPQTAPTEAPAAVAGANTSVVCFESASNPERIARITFTDRTQIGGQLRVLDGEPADYVVAGTLASGRGAVTLTDSSTGQQVDQAWVFNAASVDLGDGSVLAVVSCDTIALP